MDPLSACAAEEAVVARSDGDVGQARPLDPSRDGASVCPAAGGTIEARAITNEAGLAQQMMAQGVGDPVAVAFLGPATDGDQGMVQARIVVDPDDVAGRRAR